MEANILHKARYTARINGDKVEGLVSVDKGGIHICQNICNGHDADDKLGFRFSYWIGNQIEDIPVVSNVSNLTIYLPEEKLKQVLSGMKVIVEDTKLNVGDVIDLYGSEYTIDAVFPNSYIIINSDSGVAILYSHREFVNNGATLLSKIKPDTFKLEEETIVELTIEDISNGKGIGVPKHLIRIKDDV